MDIVLPKIVSAGIYNSQIVAKNLSVTLNRKTTMFEIEIPLEDGGLSYVDSYEKKIVENMIICAKPEQIRHTILPFKCYYIHMILNSGLLYDILMNTPIFMETEKKSKYKELFISICKHYNSTLESDKIMLNSLILKLIYLLNEESAKQTYGDKMKSSNYKIIECVLEYIKKNIASDLSLNTLAAQVKFSPIYFHNCFKTSVGKTLHEYVEEQRIKMASNLLLTTDWTLTRISEECGFSSQSYFSYAFKKKMNMTPRQYVKENFKRYENDFQ